MTTDLFLSIETLWTAVGTARCPAIIDARTDEDFAADPRLVPGAVRRPGLKAAAWAAGFAGRDAVVVCERGLKISQGAAAWLSHAGANARSLAGGFRAWRAAGLPLVPADRLPPRDDAGRTVWVAGAGPDPDRTAGAWLIRRFVDPAAVFLVVEAAEVAAVAERFGATPFGPEGASFAALLRVFALEARGLARLAAVVDGGAPEAAGFRAAVAGLAEPQREAGLEAGLGLCDAFYRWCRTAGDGAGE